MSDKKKDKVPRSDKTRLSDLTPQKQARGGKIPGGLAGVGGGPAPTPPFLPPKKNASAGGPPLNR